MNHMCLQVNSQQASWLTQQRSVLQVGPIAVTSANPTGEADTTHHNQVYAKLGDKVWSIFQFCDAQAELCFCVFW